MTKRLVIHIGSPKTGTTAIQQFLSDNRQALAAGGVNYARTGRPHIAHNAVPGQFREDGGAAFCAGLAKEIAESAVPLHVVSSELFFRPAVSRMVSTGLATHLPEALKDNLRILCYVRRPDKYVEALYKQLVKQGRIAPAPDEFLVSHIKRVSYRLALDPFIADFGIGRLDVRPFERGQFPGGDVVQDFAVRAGFPDMPDLEVGGSGSTNKTLSAEVSELMGHMSRNSGLNTRQLVRDIIAMELEGTTGSNDVYDRDTRRWIVDQFTDETTFLQQTFGTPGQDFYDYTDLAQTGLAEELSPAERRKRWSLAAHAISMAVGAQVAKLK